MKHTFYGQNRSQMNKVLNIMCELKERIPDMTKEEENAYDIAVQCVAQIANRMADGKQINWD